jgi:hypothetical protein
MLLALGVAALLAFILIRAADPIGPSAGWPAFAAFLVLALAASWLRTGLEVGTLAARCRLLAPVAPPEPPLPRFETLPPLPPPEALPPEEYDLPPESPPS